LRKLSRVSHLRGFGLLRFALMLAILSLVVASETRTSAAPNFTITVKIVGLYPNVRTRVYVNGTLNTTIYGEGTYTISVAYPTTVSVDRYVPDGYPYYGYPFYSYPGPFWGPYGYNGVAFFCGVNSYRATTTTTITFRYDPLFFLYVKSERGSPEGTGWYLAGSWARVAVATPIEEGASTRYRFDRWTGAQLQDSASTPVNLVYMDSPKIIEATWVTQYKLTVNSPYGQVSGAGWYDKDQTATFSVTTPVTGGEGIRHTFNSWIGDHTGSSTTGTVTMNAPKTVTATWKTQFLLTIDPKDGQVDKSTQWLDSGTSVSVTALSPSKLTEKKSRLVFLGWQGATTSTLNTVALVMDGPKTLTATWKWQYYLTVETKHGAPRGEGWYDDGSTAEFSVPSETPMDPPLDSLGGKYVFSGWSGDSTSTAPKATILMDGPHIVVASWTSDYSMVTAFFVILTAIVAAIGVFVVFTIRKERLGRLREKPQARTGGNLPSPSACRDLPYRRRVQNSRSRYEEGRG